MANQKKQRRIMHGVLAMSAIMLLAGTVATWRVNAEEDKSSETVTAKIPVEIQLDGAESEGKVNITVVTENAPMPKKADLAANGKGLYGITYNAPGEYDYKITQNDAGMDVITDKSVWDVHVWAGYMDDNTFGTTVIIYKEGSQKKQDEVVFKNEKKKAAVSASPAPTPTPASDPAGNEDAGRHAQPDISGGTTSCWDYIGEDGRSYHECEWVSDWGEY